SWPGCSPVSSAAPPAASSWPSSEPPKGHHCAYPGAAAVMSRMPANTRAAKTDVFRRTSDLLLALQRRCCTDGAVFASAGRAPVSLLAGSPYHGGLGRFHGNAVMAPLKL